MLIFQNPKIYLTLSLNTTLFPSLALAKFNRRMDPSNQYFVLDIQAKRNKSLYIPSCNFFAQDIAKVLSKTVTCGGRLWDQIFSIFKETDEIFSLSLVGNWIPSFCQCFWISSISLVLVKFAQNMSKQKYFFNHFKTLLACKRSHTLLHSPEVRFYEISWFPDSQCLNMQANEWMDYVTIFKTCFLYLILSYNHLFDDQFRSSSPSSVFNFLGK